MPARRRSPVIEAKTAIAAATPQRHLNEALTVLSQEKQKTSRALRSTTPQGTSAARKPTMLHRITPPAAPSEQTHQPGVDEPWTLQSCKTPTLWRSIQLRPRLTPGF
jgi:hypothetical protein